MENGINNKEVILPDAPRSTFKRLLIYCLLVVVFEWSLVAFVLCHSQGKKTIVAAGILGSFALLATVLTIYIIYRFKKAPR